MKNKAIILVVAGILIGAVVMGAVQFFLTPRSPKSALPNSFDAVTAKLDKGGQVYVYFSTERVIQSIAKMWQTVDGLLKAEIGKTGADSDYTAISSFIAKLLTDSGIGDISGIGMSSIALEKDLNHTVFVVHHDQSKGKGLIWRMQTLPAHAQIELDKLPADTVMASYSDFNMLVAWQWLKEELAGAHIAAVKTGFDSVSAGLKTNGVDLDKLFASLSGRFGFVLTLHDKNKFTMPGNANAGKNIEIPEPALAIAIGVRDNTLFELLTQKLPMLQKADEKGIKKLKLVFPLPMPFPVAIQIAQKNGTLLLATSDTLVDALLNAPQAALKQTDEFKQLAARMPTNGNSFQFVSQRFGKNLVDLLIGFNSGAMESNALMANMLHTFGSATGRYAISSCGNEGIVMTINHSMAVESMLMIPVAMIGGIIPAILIPNMKHAMENKEQSAAIAGANLATHAAKKK